MDELAEEEANSSGSDKVTLQETLESLKQMLTVNEYFVKNGDIPYEKVFNEKDLNKSGWGSESKEKKKLTKNSFYCWAQTNSIRLLYVFNCSQPINNFYTEYMKEIQSLEVSLIDR